MFVFDNIIIGVIYLTNDFKISVNENEGKDDGDF